MADIPLGSAGIGLGSSSGLAVGVLNALYAYKGQHVSAERLAQDAYKIERDVLGHPVGKQDQYMTSYGGFNFIRFNRDDSVYVDPIICSKQTKEELNKKLLLFYTGMTRVSSDVLMEQQKLTESNLDLLNYMVQLTQELADSLSKNKLTQFGEILHEGGVYKKKLAKGITNPKLDEYYETARANGAIGGKVLGAGGGGFLVLYCEEKSQDAVRQSLAHLKERKFAFEPQGSKIIYVSD